MSNPLATAIADVTAACAALQAVAVAGGGPADPADKGWTLQLAAINEGNSTGTIDRAKVMESLQYLGLDGSAVMSE